MQEFQILDFHGVPVYLLYPVFQNMQFPLQNMTLMESLSKATVMKSLLNLETSCCKENLKKLGQSSQKAVGIWNSLPGYKYQQNQTEKIVQVTGVKQMTKIQSCSQVLKLFLVEVWQ